MRRGRFRWQRFAWVAGLSLVFHVYVVIPKLIEPVTTMMSAATREELEEVAFLPDIDPSSGPSTDPTVIPPPDPEKPDEKKKPEPPKVAKLEKPPEPAELPELPKPKPEPPKPVVQAPPPPPPPQPKRERKQMVSQEKFEDEADNADARYLSEKNHRTKEDTRMESTNLLRETEGAKEKSAPNENKDKNVGEKDQKIAELEEHKGTDIPREAQQQGNEGKTPDKKQPEPGPLSMRNLVPRADDKAQTQREGVEVQEKAQGDLPMQRRGEAGQKQAASTKGGPKVNLTLDHHAYDRIEGYATAEKERREAARAETSHVKGRYDRYLDKVGALRAALENFTPDVKVGNQAELGTRADPFAHYIDSMHRQIHKIFTFGFLADHDMRAGKDPFDDMTLYAQVQISLNGDGTIDKVGIIHSSGSTLFDAVAIDSVRSAGPFQKPPAVIRSANGKVYLDWQFHRDERACGTFGVDAHILTTPGDNVEHDTSETGGSHRPLTPGGTSPAPTATQKPPSSPAMPESEPRSLNREATPAKVPEISKEVHTTVEGWFQAWSDGDVAWLAGYSAVPFVAGGTTSARSATELKNMYKQMLAEGGTRKVTDIEVLTPGGVRSKLGALPPGGAESDMLYAVGKAGADRFVLLLRPSSQGWRVSGLVR